MPMWKSDRESEREGKVALIFSPVHLYVIRSCSVVLWNSYWHICAGKIPFVRVKNPFDFHTIRLICEFSAMQMWTVRIFFGFNAISFERNRKNAHTQVIAAKLYQRKRCQCRREPLPTKTESQYECGCQRKCFKFTHLLQCTCNIAKHQKCGKLLVFRSVCEISVAHIGRSQSEQLLFIVFFSVFKIECIHLFWRCEVRFSIIFNEIFPMSTFISCISSIFLNQNYLIWSLLYFFNGFFLKFCFLACNFCSSSDHTTYLCPVLSKGEHVSFDLSISIEFSAKKRLQSKMTFFCASKG